MKSLIELNKGLQSMYIQGFADGEGSCSKDGKHISITQKDPAILKEIHDSLSRTFKIKSTLHYIESSNVYRIVITGQINLRRFYENISFRASGKRNRLSYGINNFKRRSPSYEDYLVAIGLKKEGWSLRQIAKELGVSYGAVRKWVNNISKPVSLPEGADKK